MSMKRVGESGTGGEFFGAGMDLFTDTFTEEEKARTLEWYRRVHDHGALDLAPFSRFLIENDPAGFKRLRRHMVALDEPLSEPAMPTAVGVMLCAHSFLVCQNGKGGLYEIVALRGMGATKAEILEMVAMAFVNGGSPAINPLAEVGDGYMNDWLPGDEPGIAWPEGWGPDPKIFRSGIDLSSDHLFPGEFEKIAGWYRAMHGEVPEHLEFFARVAPSAFKTRQARFESAVAGALPAQLIPLFSLHLSAIKMAPAPLRRSLQMAKALGVRRREAVTTLFWAAVFGGDMVMETAFDAARDILTSW